jgi:hypothetical protein
MCAIHCKRGRNLLYLGVTWDINTSSDAGTTEDASCSMHDNRVIERANETKRNE